MDKQNVLYAYNGILLSLKREGNSDTCYNMDELSYIMLSEINQAPRVIYCDSTSMRYLEESNS
jgi:hypothetical protein